MQIINVKELKSGKQNTLAFRFKSINQLFDESDNRLLPYREVSELAEETIFSYVDLYPVRAHLDLVIELPQEKNRDSEIKLIDEAIHNHFKERIPDIIHYLKLTNREGMYSSIITLVNAIFGLTFLYFMNTGDLSATSIPVEIIGFLLVIANWASMWNTYEFYFYDYRTLYRKKRLYNKISLLPVSVKTYPPFNQL